MRERIRDLDRLHHIDECITNINNYIQGKSYEDMKADIVDMRNLLIHGYITTNSAYIWDSYTNDLPLLKEQVKKYIAELSMN